MSDIAIEVNCETGEVIERPLTAEEIADREAAAQAAATTAAPAAAAQRRLRLLCSASSD